MKFFSPQHLPGHNDEVGGKARQLFRLLELNLSVPQFVVIPAGEAIEEQPTEAWEQLLASFVLAPNEPLRFAVRSSAIEEDGSQHSFAGQFETFLNVAPEDVPEYAKQVRASAQSERVVAYRKEKGLPDHQGMAVIVQVLVDAEVAGVAFGMEPVSGERKVKVVSALWGLGEALVGGELNADTYRLAGNQVSSVIAQKDRAMRRTDTGTGYQAVASNLQKIPCLSDAQVQEIGAVLDQLDRAWGRPQDLEFAWKDEQLVVLQARPITHLHRLPDPDGEYIVWDNSNIIESYPGVTTPLTFSFILRIYAAVYQQLAALLGVNAKVIAQHESTFANMLGLLNGRVYYNLLSWYRLLAMVPGYELNAAFMEKMMGVKERFDLPPEPAPSRWTSYRRIANTVIGILRNLITLPRQRREFQKELNASMAHYEAIDLSQLRPDELMHLEQEFEQVLLKKWKAPLVNDFFAMIFFGTFEKLLTKWGGPENAARLNDLLIGSEDIISAVPAQRLKELSQQIRENQKWLSLFEGKSDTELRTLLEQGELGELGANIQDYLHHFGERCVGELKLETVSYRQNPLPFIRILKGYATAPVAVGTIQHTPGKHRDTAESELKKALRGQWLRRPFLFWWLKHTRSLVSNRENLRFERTRAFGMVRALFSAFGQKLFAEGQLEHPRDVFYLTRNELFDHVKGTSVNGPLLPLVELRKTQFAAYEAAGPTAERIVSRGIVYQGHDFSTTAASKEPIVGDLQGLGACPGRVRAQVQVVQDPSEISSLNGDILVTASTDPGWVMLFPSAGAILVERGSLLSHSAIVSRELGIPCVVGITGLLQTLKTGDWVEMDGTSGQVKRLEGPEG